MVEAERDAAPLAIDRPPDAGRGGVASPGWVERHQRALLVSLAVGLLAAGIALCADYGIGWDEPAERAYGHTTWRYVLNGDPALLSFPDRMYGPAHEMLVSVVERFGQAGGVPPYASRHLANFLLFGVAVTFFYRLARRASGSATAAFIGCLCLVLSPPIFASAFYNGKDLPVLSWYVIAASSLLGVLERPGPARAIWHAVACAWLICIRVVGLLMPALTVLGFVWYFVQHHPAGVGGRRRLAFACTIYLILLPVLVVLFWPALWPSPLHNFVDAVRVMSHFPWPERVLYAGHLIPATRLPWHYAPVWIVISTPPVYLAAFAIGLVALLTRFARRRLRMDPFPMLVLLWAALPPAAVIGLHSVIFDSWRHLFFIYPAILLIAVYGGTVLYHTASDRLHGRGRTVALAAAGILLAVNCAVTASFMVREHPHEGTYFNGLVGGIRGARFRYEMDYWGVSYRAGLQMVLRRDPAPLIRVFVAEPVGEWNREALPAADRQRLVFVTSPDEAKYFLGAYRFQQAEYPYTHVFGRVLVDNVPVLSVFVLR